MWIVLNRGCANRGLGAGGPRSRRRVAAVAALALAAALGAGAPAVAAQKDATPDRRPLAVRQSQAVVVPQGVFKDKAGKIVGGWAVLSTESSGARQPTKTAARPDARVSAGGGTWDYGTYVDSRNYKHCWSFYYHGSKRHGATARFVYASSRSVDAPAGSWANAEPDPFNANYSGTCEVFWRVF